LPFFSQHNIGKKAHGFPWVKVAAGTFRYNHMDMGIPLEVTAEGMKGADDAWSEGFLMIEGVHPVGDSAVDKFCRNGISSIGLISRAAGIAETGFAAEGYIVEMITVMAVIEAVALFKVTAVKHFLDFILDNRADAWIG